MLNMILHVSVQSCLKHLFRGGHFSIKIQLARIMLIKLIQVLFVLTHFQVEHFNTSSEIILSLNGVTLNIMHNVVER